MTDPTITQELAALREIATDLKNKKWESHDIQTCGDLPYKVFEKRGTKKTEVCQVKYRKEARFIASAPRQMALIELMAAEIEQQAREIEHLKNTNNCRACNGSSWND